MQGSPSLEFVSAFLALFSLAGFGGAQSVPINGPPAREERSGTVTEFLYASGGARVVWRVDREVDGRFQLFSWPFDGSAPSVQLNAPAHPDSEVTRFVLAAGDRVVYLADDTWNFYYELFSVPADGSSAPIRLSSPGSYVTSFTLDPTGTYAVYRHGQSRPYPMSNSLYVVPIDGSAAPELLVAADSIDGFWIGPDGTVVYGVLLESLQAELLAVPADGSAPPMHLTWSEWPAPHNFRSFAGVQFTPDGTRIVYSEVSVNQYDQEAYFLFSAPLDASAPKVELGWYFSGEFTLTSSTPSRVVWLGEGVESILPDGTQYVRLSPFEWSVVNEPQVVGIDVIFAGSSNFTGSLFRAPVDGSVPATMLFPPVDGGIDRFALAAPDTLAFVRGPYETTWLHAAPLAGGTPLPLHPAPAEYTGPSEIVPHPDGQRVLFRGRFDYGRDDLFVVPLDASAPPLQISTGEDGVVETRVTSDEEHAVYRTLNSTETAGDLFCAPLDGGSPPVLLNEHVFGATVGDVESFQLTPDGTHLVYRADQVADEHHDLYAYPVDGSNPPLALTTGLPTVLPGFALTPDGTRAVFQVLDDSQNQLHVAPLDGAPRTTLVTGSSLMSDLTVSADGTLCVYRRHFSFGSLELRSVALDGLTPSVRLHPAIGPGRTVSSFRVGPGDEVVFLSDFQQDDVFELYVVDGEGGTPVKLSRTPVTGGDVTEFQLAPDGSAVAYLADERVNNRFELFLVPRDGARPPVRLNGALAVGGDVFEFAFTQDGRRLLYRADQRADFRFELFEVLLEGLTPPQGHVSLRPWPRARLLAAVPPVRGIQSDWRLTSDGAEVVYRANADVQSDLELYRIAVGGGSAPVAIDVPLVTGGDVLAFELAPDGASVVYRADQRVNGVDELFTVPLAGGPSVQLALLPGFADVTGFRVAPDSTHVAFRADGDANGIQELYHVPLTGGTASRVNPPLPPGGMVETDFVALNGGTLYRADQMENDTIELFLGTYP